MCTQEVCPACHRDLPEQWRNRRVFTMAMAGARGSGKSVYIAVAVESFSPQEKSIKRRFSTRPQSRVAP